MLLAELEIWHTRPVTPTRRVALGPPRAAHRSSAGAWAVCCWRRWSRPTCPTSTKTCSPISARLIDQVARGERIVQPRLQHRYQVDRHGLAVSVHQLNGDADNVTFDLHSMGRPLSQVLGAVYALERIELRRSRAASRPCCTARCAGAVRSGRRSSPTSAVSVAATWSVSPIREYGRSTLLGFPMDTGKVTKKEVMAHFRPKPARGASRPRWRRRRAGDAIERLGEARRILLRP